jgi:hypothetical protein
MSNQPSGCDGNFVRYMHTLGEFGTTYTAFKGNLQTLDYVPDKFGLHAEFGFSWSSRAPFHAPPVWAQV